MWLLKKIIDLVLYGNFWIALGALALTFQTQFIFTGDTGWNELIAFVFFSTWLLYALHRIVGILRLKNFLDIERYSVIARFRHHIIVYAIIASIGTLWFFFQLSFSVQVAVVLPGFFSIAYVVPFFGRKRRLRDFNQIKIYLVAFVWGWVTVVLPAVYFELGFSWSLVLLFLERSLFVFAITLPFDIRDLNVDEHSNVSTIPAVIGIKKTIRLALILLVLCVVFAAGNYILGFYTLPVLLVLIASFISTALLVWKSTPERHDYFYSGLMDGTMVLQGGGIWLCSYMAM